MGGPVDLALLPMNSVIGENGDLSIAGVNVLELVEKYGTPLFIYDEDEIRVKLQEAISAFGPNVAYASKAFLCRAMAELVVEEGSRIDVSTGGEMAVAMAGGIDPSKIVFHGNNKSTRELTEAISIGVGTIVVDSFDEIERIKRLASMLLDSSSKLKRVKVLLRVTPGVEAHTHEFVRTGQEDTKFGFSLASGAALKACEIIKESEEMTLSGIHFHIGSQIFLNDGFLAAIEAIGPLVNSVGVKELVIGGGLGVAYVNGEDQLSMKRWADEVKKAVKASGIAGDVEVTAEPGRSIVAHACITVYQVGTIKKLPGIRNYIAVDGGMSDNPRPVLYGSGYEAFLPREANAQRPMKARLVGKHCETGDVLVFEAHLPDDVEVGDFVATPVTGAYGYSMASNYNKVPRPAVVFVSLGQDRLVIRRETTEDLLRLDQ
ncbi:MAG: diaminopimelate decarboxylase [Acidimicrobiales bacterium]|nr:diaminopimelate decarboxylase [Acidimicrobiales bacterium]